jgi:type II secretory pathway component PulJ
MQSGRTDIRSWRGFSIGEMLAALVIAAFVLTAILSVYNRVQQAGNAVVERMDSPSLGDEVLHLIARDLDRTVGAEGVTIQVRNGFEDGFSRAQLTIRQVYRDAQGNDQTLYQIVWQAGRDYDGGATGMILYRSYEGVLPEDKLFEGKRESWEKSYPFVPVCRGVTYFRIDIPTQDKYLDRWTDTTLPAGVRISLSTAQPYEAADGTWTVLDEQKRIRTVAVDRTRTMRVDMPAATRDANEPNKTSLIAGDPNAARRASR